MNYHEIEQAFLSLDDDERLTLILALAAKLTVFARDTYVPQSEEIAEPTRLRRLNELQHRLLFYLSALNDKNPHRYPEDVILKMLMIDFPSDWPELEQFIRAELSQGLSRVSPK